MLKNKLYESVKKYVDKYLFGFDKIVVLEEGELKESGTHEELMQIDGLYRKLYEIQYRETVTA